MRLRPNFVLFLAFFALLFVGCESADHPTAPGGSTLSITASSTKIGLSGSANLEVRGFRPNGNPLPQGTQIRFSASLGLIEPAIAVMDANGVARSTFKADGRTGTASITASINTSGGGSGSADNSSGNEEEGTESPAGSGTGSGTASATVSIEVSELKPTLLISANPSVLQVQETSAITVTARDENSLPLGAGEEILLTANLGTLRKNGASIDSVLTEQDGRAQFTFLAGTQAGTGSVKALLRNSDEATISLEIRDAPASFTFNASPTELGNSGGAIELTATVVNGEGVALPGVLVRFESEKGPSFDPSSSVTTNTRGEAIATATYDSGLLTSGETFEVSATVRVGNEDQRKSITITVL